MSEVLKTEWQLVELSPAWMTLRRFVHHPEANPLSRHATYEERRTIPTELPVAKAVR